MYLSTATQRIVFSIFSIAFLFLLTLPSSVLAAASDIERVSLSSAGVEGNNFSYDPAITPDGRYVAFDSDATNLVTGDTNAKRDIFVYDRNTDTIERVSVTDAGVQGNNHSYLPSISSDGRYVAFYSNATNLVTGDTNGSYDIFVYDRTTDTIQRASLTSVGAQADSDSILSDGNDAVPSKSISADGRYVTFHSYATNLVAGDTNGATDIFVRDLIGSSTERVSVSDAAAEANAGSLSASISGDGRYVAFDSTATNLVASDSNARSDIFVYDRNTDTIERVSVTDAGVQGNGNSFGPTLSTDGRYVAFHSVATNLVTGDTNGVKDVFVYDRNTDTIERVSVTDAGVQGNGNSENAQISPDGGFVAFESVASNLVADDTFGVRDVFVFDRGGDTIQRVSLKSDGGEVSSNSTYPAIATDGLYAAFFTSAALLPDDTNGSADIYVATPTPPDTTAPTITILGDNPATVTQGDTYTDAGATAEDDTDGDLTGDINTTNSVDTATVGTYTVVYDVTDAADNTAYATRTVNVIAPAEDDDDDSGGGSSSHRHSSGGSSSGDDDNDDDPDTIARLEALIIELKAKLASLLAGTPALSHNPYTRDLTLGSQGDDVKQLQLYLIAKNGGPKTQALTTAGATGYFGPLTQAALAEFQASVGITPPAGYFGPLTRGYIASH